MFLTEDDDEDEKLLSQLVIGGQTREVWMLTEDGLYEILMQSRKPIAKSYKKKKGERKMQLVDIINKYEIAKEKKGVVYLCVPEDLKDSIECLLISGYAHVKRGKNHIYIIYDIDDLRQKTGLKFDYK